MIHCIEVCAAYFVVSVGHRTMSDVNPRRVHSSTHFCPAEAAKRTMRTLARNMAFLLKSIALGREKYGLPEKEEHIWTHFIIE